MMMKTALALLTMLAIQPGLAQAPDEATKIKALKKAYELNGNSMVRWGSIDLSKYNFDEAPPVVVRTIPIVPPAPPVLIPSKKKLLDAVNDAPTRIITRSDICKRHGLRKIINGKSWHCRK
jgi:hypothetical protein